MSPSASRLPRGDPGTPGHVFLGGFMASGKTSVGRLLARRLALPFVDLDELVGEAAGAPIERVFAAEGEQGFRDRERVAVTTLAGCPRAVVALGGWTVGDEANRRQIAAQGTLICLSASPATIAARLAADPRPRPLLPQPSPADVSALLAERRGVYDAVALRVNTDGRSVAEVVEWVVRLLELPYASTFSCHVLAADGGTSRILVGQGALDAAGTLAVASDGAPSRLAVVTDDVGRRLAFDRRAGAAFARAGLPCVYLTMGHGEPAKALDTVEALASSFVGSGLDREALVCAVGGGVVSDTAGFAAATFMRGVRWMAVPTTLLAMVDASIGGKTGVNLAAGKNLVGAFWLPSTVAIDPGLLATMPAPLIRQGLAEVVKAAIIGDAVLWDRLAGGGAPRPDDAGAWTELIALAIAVKVDLVGQDSRDHGARLALNLGHTFAHGFEVASGYRLPHGDAVATGLVVAARLAARRGLARPALESSVRDLCEHLGLPTRLTGLDARQVFGAMASDKKRQRGRLRFVLPRGIGEGVAVDEIADEVVLSALDTVLTAK